MIRTGFENLESLIQAHDKLDHASITAVKEAMIEDWHMLFHDAAWEPDCPVCDRERAGE